MSALDVLGFLGNFIGSLTASNAEPTSTLSPSSPATTGTTVIKIERKIVTDDGIFGNIEVNGEYVCQTVENLEKAIAEGLYDAAIDMSPRLQYETPHLKVPMRDEAAGGDAGIRIHVLNEPSRSEGCVGVGTMKDGDAEDNSKTAFQLLMSKLPLAGVPFKVLVLSVH